MKYLFKKSDKKILSSLISQNKKLEKLFSKEFLNILSKREVVDLKEYIFPNKEFYDPFLFKDMKKAVERIIKAIKNKERIYIHGDFDADGICATSIMFDYLYFKSKANVLPYIPSRVDEGYGLSESSLNAISEKELKEPSKGKPLVISVDCGIRDDEFIDKIWADKFDFIITDHHDFKMKGDRKCLSKKAKAIIHPRITNTYPFGNICGAAVAWKVVCGINSVLKNCDQNEYLDLVSIATICDVMPLIDENRKFVKFGLLELQNTKRIGLQKLLDIAGVSGKVLSPYHIGFVLGPRLNASGRLGRAIDAVKLICTQKEELAIEYAKKLNDLNIQRQEITQQLYIEAKKDLKLEDKLIIVKGIEWPEGVVGLIAGRLTEEFTLPSIVFSIHEDKITGSARSVKEIDITKVIGKYSKYLIKYGGHSQAAGLSVIKDKFEVLISEMTLHVNTEYKERELTNIKNYLIDEEIELKKIKMGFVKELSFLEPIGYGNLEPIFLIKNLVIDSISSMGKVSEHVRITFKNDEKEYIQMIGFNLSNILTNKVIKEGDKVNLLVNLKINTWKEQESVEIRIKDIEKV